jgi:MoxR-like ATPase
MKNPDYKEDLERIFKYESDNIDYRTENGGLGWTYHKTGVSPQRLKKMMLNDILETTYKSSKYTQYQLKNRDGVEKFLSKSEEVVRIHDGDYDSISDIAETIYDALNDKIIGNHHVKKVIYKFIKSPRKSHLMFSGPPASGKSLIGEIISKYVNEPMCVFISATDLSAAGLFNILENSRPKILIIDEIDKIKNKGDLDTLHSLMWEGKIRRVKGDYITDWIELNTKVIGIANDLSKLRQSILSRFLKFEMNEPSKDEFIIICVKSIMHENQDISKELSEYISEKTYDKTRDVRTAVMVANLSPDTKEEIDNILDNIK